MQDPLYWAAARSVVHWLAVQAGLVCKNGRLHPSVALIRLAAYSCLLYVWPWSPARLAILSPHVSLSTCTKIGFLRSVSLILTPTSQQERASRRQLQGTRMPQIPA